MPISQERQSERDSQRRQLLVRAARECFLQYGYAKTSLDDIAQSAGISRPLIYRKFKNKDALHAAVLESFFEGRDAQVESALAARGSKKEKLARVYELLLVEPWDERASAPMAHELDALSATLHPELEAKRQRLLLKFTQAVLGAKELSELFMLAASGLTSDRPATKILRRRMELLAGQFADA